MQASHHSPIAVHSLSVGEALTLCLREPGVLRVTQGRMWATIDVDGSSPVADAGDHFVVPGQDLHLRAGQRVVLEAWPVQGQASIQWQWLLAAPKTEPVHDLGRGLAMVVRAMTYRVSARA